MEKQTMQETGALSAKAPEAVDALELLKSDHRSVEKLFDAFDQAGDSLEDKGALAKRVCEELTVHTIIEEEIVYPAADEALPADDEVDVNEAYVEHFLVKTLIEKFASLKPGDQGFDATFKVMSELVRHHVEEEENELFPKLRKAGLDLASLGESIAARKVELLQKLDGNGGRASRQTH